MQKLLTILSLVVLFVSLTNAQVYRKGANNLNIGIGPGLAGIYGSMDIPAISVGFQAGVHEKISVGGIVGYSASTFGEGQYEWTYSYIFIGARGEYHFVDLDVDDFDLYGGVTLGYNIVSVSEPDNYPGNYGVEGSYLLYGFHLGGRYYFTPTVGAFLELGYGVGYIVVGVSFRL